MAGTTDDDDTTLHGILIQAKWEWATKASSGRWSRQQQGIKPKRFYISESADTPRDDGHGILFSKLKLRGQGKAVALRFESEDGKDFQLLGWQVPFTSETTE